MMINSSYGNKSISKCPDDVKQSKCSQYISTSKRSLGIWEQVICDDDSPSQHIYIPMKTDDYIINRGSKGLGLIANRDIHEGESIFQYSLQFTITDVEYGDHALFNVSKLLARNGKEAFNVVPSRVPLQPEMIFTHAIPVLSDDPSGKSSGIISHYLKVPTLLMNHSCDPNVIQDGGKDGHERHFAVRDIRRGEELNINYSLIYYDEGPIHHKCLCRSSNCVGQILGFKDLEIDQQSRLLPVVSEAVRAMYQSDLRYKDKLLFQQPLIAERVVQAPMFSTKQVIRMVCSGPSSSMSEVGIRMNDDGTNGLFSLRRFERGEIVYKFWVDEWPMEGKIPIEMVCPTATRKDDLVEGTSLWLDPKQCGYRTSQGKVIFSSFHDLIEHRCDPNIVYKQTKRTEKDNWQIAYAARTILEGENLTADLNSMFWDRSGVKIATCSCGSENCAGTVKGFKFLSNIKQKQRWVERDNGRHLSPHVREQCKKCDEYYHDLVDYDSELKDRHSIEHEEWRD